MARPREFDSDAVLESAMRVFWAKGYESTSLDDICAATGINRSSLYASFGDKRALLLKTIERYSEGGPTRIAAALARPVPVREAIAGILSDFIDSIVAGPGRTGCFIGNCAAELAQHDRQAMQIVRRALQNIEAAFETGFARAKSRGELKRTADVTALARFFMASFQGLRLIGKTNPDRKVLQDIAETMLRVLD